MIKKILYSVLSFILLVMTVQFVLQIQSNHQAIVFTSEAAFLAFLLSLNVTGIFAFIGFVFPTHRLLPEQYFKIRNSKSVVRWYKLL